MKIQIKNRFTGALIFEHVSTENTIKKTVEKYIKKELKAGKSYADLSYADLSSADLSYADLCHADLCHADLCYADLSHADLGDVNLRYADLRSADLDFAHLGSTDLSYVDLSSADLSHADLGSANLEPIKNDFFAVLLRGITEVGYLKKNLIEGNIDGSTYEGECACLSGTLANGTKTHNGKADKVMKQILSCRDGYRPIERFFLGIKKGDTPQNNSSSKIALEWIEEFESYVSLAGTKTSER